MTSTHSCSVPLLAALNSSSLPFSTARRNARRSTMIEPRKWRRQDETKGVSDRPR